MDNNFIDMPLLSHTTRDADVAPRARIAMRGLDEWRADAERTLVGRRVVRTGEKDALRGAICEITSVAVAAGASGYHLLVTAPKVRADRVGVTVTRHVDRDPSTANHRLLEIGVTCELIAEEDIPAL